MSGSSWLRFAQRSGYRGLFLLTFATSPSILAEIRPSDCARAAQYSERRRGVSMLVIQNGRTVFEHYANGGSATGRWPIFSGTKSFWGIAALAAVRDGFFKLDDPVSDTIAEWKSDSRKSQSTIRQLLNQTDGIEGASRLQRASIRDRNAMAFRLPVIAEPGTAFIYGPSHLQIFSELLRRKLGGRGTIAYFEEHVSDRLRIGHLNYKKDRRGNPLDRKSTRLNSSHRTISYAVFCLKKKTTRRRKCPGRFGRTRAHSLARPMRLRPPTGSLLASRLSALVRPRRRVPFVARVRPAALF